jgi:hypothetical protein
MKHILNNLTEEEKNSIREQHTDGKKIVIENFDKLINSKLGDSKPLVNEQSTVIDPVTGKKQTVIEIGKMNYDLQFPLGSKIKFYYDDVNRSFELVDMAKNIRYHGNIK